MQAETIYLPLYNHLINPRRKLICTSALAEHIAMIPQSAAAPLSIPRRFFLFFFPFFLTRAGSRDLSEPQLWKRYRGRNDTEISKKCLILFNTHCSALWTTNELVVDYQASDQEWVAPQSTGKGFSSQPKNLTLSKRVGPQFKALSELKRGAEYVKNKWGLKVCFVFIIASLNRIFCNSLFFLHPAKKHET